MPARDRLRKAYVDTAHGQLHYRDAGEGDVLVLNHWTPLSGRMYAGVAELFADAGWRVLAFDLLGYGRSDPRPEVWSFAAYAENLLEALDRLGVGPVRVLGGHNGASVAAEMAIAAPERVRAVVLDGAPLPSPELRAAFRRMTGMSRPRAEAEGGHEAVAWRRTLGLLQEYRPGFEVTDETIEDVWPALIDYLETDFVSSGPIAGDYDLGERLPLIGQPTLLLGAEKDSLSGAFSAARDRLPAAKTHFFTGHHPIHFPERASEYVDVVAPFLQRSRAPA